MRSLDPPVIAPDSANKTQRVRDPVHGLIVFESDGGEAARDHFAWRLLNTPEMQRLRRIKQLGVSEFTFPGATHSRFSHSLGVFHVARQLTRILKRVLPDAEWSDDRAEVATYAALLHDVGHGPFSHAFERVQDSRGEHKDHESWTAELILAEDGKIRSTLERRRRGMADEVAKLLRSKVPEDAFHAIVSSSFDADRLDYLRRDRLMTGSGVGAIDFDWLLDNLRVTRIRSGSDDDETEERIATFCLRRRAMSAAEAFLLARYHLFEQVYLHKATRGMEVLVEQLIHTVASAALAEEPERIGLDRHDRLVVFFASGGQGLENYRTLDDAVVWAAAGRIAAGPDPSAAHIARRLLDRERLVCLDVEAEFPRRADEPVAEAQARWQRIAAKIDPLVPDRGFKDVVSFNAYGEIGADQTRTHQRLMIQMEDREAREITNLSDLVSALPRRELIRYYFESAEMRKRAMDQVNERA